MLDLFSGIGGFSLAASWTGQIETVAFCEIDPYCQRVIKKHWPGKPIYPNIKELNGHELVRRHGTIDIVCGGFPCQPWSIAGEQMGECDSRNMWPDTFRVISEANPGWFIGENVPGLSDEYLDKICSDLEGKAFTVWTIEIPAIIVGAPHLRNRLCIMAHSNRKGLEGLYKEGHGIDMQRPQKVISRNIWEATPEVYRPGNGIPFRVERTTAGGNSIVPQVFYQIFQVIVDVEGGAL